MQRNAGGEAAQPVLVPSPDTRARTCVVTTSAGSVWPMSFSPTVNARHIMREVVTRHNAMYKDLGRIKRKRLAVCSSAKDKQGYMLSSDMVLQDIAGADTSLSVYFIAYTKYCTQAKKRTGSALDRGGAPVPKKVKAASPTGVAAVGTPVEGSEKRGRPTFEEEEGEAGGSSLATPSSGLNSSESDSPDLHSSQSNSTEDDSAKDEVSTSEGNSAAGESNEDDSSTSDGDSSEGDSSEPDDDSVEVDSSELEEDSVEVDSSEHEEDSDVSEPEDSDLNSPEPVFQMAHDQIADTCGSSFDHSQEAEMEASAAVRVLAEGKPPADEHKSALAGTGLTAVTSRLGACFTDLTRVFLWGASPDQSAPHLDLAPLQTLQSLSCLELEEGWFANVNAAPHLTRLAIRNADAMSSSDCTFCSSLVDLQLRANGSITMHARGVCACTALQSLRVGEECNVYAQDLNALDTRHSAMINSAFLLPADMSCLTALTSLSLDFSGFAQQADFSGLSMLASLKALDLTKPGYFKVSKEFSCLKGLTRLWIGNPHGMGCARLLVNWKPLQALRKLCVLSDITCDDRVLALAALENLEYADFVHARAVDAVSKQWLGTLDLLLDHKRASAPSL